MDWHIGCSGFHYKEWKGVFYPEGMPQRQWFDYYSSHFNTLELNVTFYRFPRVSFLENWYAKTPDDFLFAVKVPRLISHYKQLKDTASLLDDFYSTIRHGLRDKMGPVLFQLPPQYQFTEKRLERILAAVDISFENVVEFRHASWWTKAVMATLARKGISFCGISYPGLPEEAVVNTNIAYYRFHGMERLYYSAYKNKELEKVYNMIRKSKAGKAYIYFNNTATAAAIENASYFEQFVIKKEKRSRKATSDM